VNLAPRQRAPLLVLGFVALVAGTGAGLVRMGWELPAPWAMLVALHGPLMICGFFGTVIALERAVALGRLWAYAAPLAAGLATLALLAGFEPAARWLYVAGGAVLLAATLVILKKQFALFTLTLAIGASAWLAGSLAWAAGLAVHEVAPWWIAFLVLTIAGERLELSRLRPPSPVAVRVFAALLAACLAGLAAGGTDWGRPLFAGSLLALAAWLVRQDVARRTVHGKGLTRFIAVALLAGYAWLAMGSAIALVGGGFAPGSRAYDAALHAILIGFVFSMVFGHAPVIFPSVVRVKMPYHPTFYLPLLALHVSLLVRFCGDGLAVPELVSLGGLLNAAALALFILSTLASVIRGLRQAKS
jgi:hypothetical protein